MLLFLTDEVRCYLAGIKKILRVLKERCYFITICSIQNQNVGCQVRVRELNSSKGITLFTGERLLHSLRSFWFYIFLFIHIERGERAWYAIFESLISLLLGFAICTYLCRSLFPNDIIGIFLVLYLFECVVFLPAWFSSYTVTQVKLETQKLL